MLYTPPDDFTGDTVFDYSITDPDGLIVVHGPVTVVGQDFNGTGGGRRQGRTRARIPSMSTCCATTRTTRATRSRSRRSAVEPRGGVAPVSSGVIVTPQLPASPVTTRSPTRSLMDSTARRPQSCGWWSPLRSTSNRPPEAVDDRASTSASNSVSIGVLANDTDPDGDPLASSMCRPPPAWNWRSSTAAPSRLPAATTSGLLTFTYRRGHGWYGNAEVALVVDPAQADRPPKAVDDKATSASVLIPIDLIATTSIPTATRCSSCRSPSRLRPVGRWSRLAAHGAVHTRPRLHRLRAVPVHHQ